MGDLIMAIHYNEYKKKVCNIISPHPSSSYYDELITKLQRQAMTEYQYDKSQRQQQEQEIQLQTSNKKRKVLLVDDESDHCLTYQLVLQDASYECVSYTESVKALQEFRPNYYDLVILDIKMPKLDGFALCEKIREVDNTVQIIFITAGEVYYENFRNQYLHIPSGEEP